MAIDIDKDGYMRSRNGMVQGAVVGLSFIGGLINIFAGGGFLAFLLWSTFFISGGLLLTNVFSVHAVINARFGFFWKVEFGYIVIWTILYLIAAIISFIPFQWTVSNIVGYFIVFLFAADLFFRYRIYKGAPTGAPANPPETVEQGEQPNPASAIKDKVASMVSSATDGVSSTIGSSK